MLLVGDDGNRRVHAHAARVGAFVVFVGALVILGGRHGNHGDAIGEREHRAFGAGHHLLEDDRGARLAKASVKALANGLVSFLLGERNRYALASRQTVGLDDDGRTLLVKVGKRRVAVREGAVCRRGQIVLHHETLGEVLGPLDAGAGCTGTKAVDAGIAHDVGDAGDERSLRADDHEFAVILAGEVDDGPTILDVERDVGAEFGRASVAGSDEKPVALG